MSTCLPRHGKLEIETKYREATNVSYANSTIFHVISRCINIIMGGHFNLKFENSRPNMYIQKCSSECVPKKIQKGDNL